MKTEGKLEKAKLKMASVQMQKTNLWQQDDYVVLASVQKSKTNLWRQNAYGVLASVLASVQKSKTNLWRQNDYGVLASVQKTKTRTDCSRFWNQVWFGPALGIIIIIVCRRRGHNCKLKIVYECDEYVFAEDRSV